jgi:hypothetical protein
MSAGIQKDTKHNYTSQDTFLPSEETDIGEEYAGVKQNALTSVTVTRVDSSHDFHNVIIRKACRLYSVIREMIVWNLAPSALKSSFLDPLEKCLYTEVRLLMINAMAQFLGFKVLNSMKAYCNRK